MATSVNFKVKNGLVVTTTASIFGINQSTSTTTGALTVTGGVGIGGNLNVLGNVNVGTPTAASLLTVNNTTTSALAIQSNASFVSPNSANTVTIRMLDSDVLTFSGSAGQLFSISDNFTGTIFAVNDISGVPSIEVYDTGLVSLAEFTGNVGIGTTSTTAKLTLNGGATISGITTVTNTATSISTTTGALQVVGGVGIGGSTVVGGTASIINTTSATSTNTGALQVVGGVGIGGNLYVGGEIVAQRLTIQLTTVTTTLVQTDDIIQTYNTTNSVSTTTGALQITGGAGIGRDVWIGGTLNVAGGINASITGTITTASTVVITNDTTTSIAQYLTFVSTSSGNQSIKVDASDLAFIPSTGRLGLGTSTPGQKLTVNGLIRLHPTGNLNNFGDLDYSANGYIGTDASTGLRAGNGYYYADTFSGSAYLKLGFYGHLLGTGSWPNGSFSGLAYYQSNIIPNIAGYNNKLLDFRGTITNASTAIETLNGLYTILNDNSTVTNTLYGVYADVSGGTNTTSNRYAATFLGGNVGIGTSSPIYKLDVVDSSAGTIRARTSVSGNAALIAQTAAGGTGYVQLSNAAGDHYIYGGNGGTQNISFNVSGAEQMRINSTGLGIGTNSPGARLDVFGNARIGYNTTSSSNVSLDITAGNSTQTSVIDFGYWAAGGFDASIWKIGRTGATSSVDNFSIDFTASGFSQTRFMIDSSGNVGIGTSSTVFKVDTSLGSVNNNTTNFGYNVLADAAANIGYSGYNMTLTNSTANASGFIRLARTSSTLFLGMEIQSQSRDGIRFLTGASSPTETVRINASGITTIQTNTNATSTSSGALQVTGGVGIGGNLYVGGGNVVAGINTVTNTTPTNSTSTGALQVQGGIGVAGGGFFGGVVTATSFVGSFAGTIVGNTYPLILNDISNQADGLKAVFPLTLDQTAVTGIGDNKDLSVTVNGIYVAPYVKEKGLPWINPLGSYKGFRVATTGTSANWLVLYNAPDIGSQIVVTQLNISPSTQVRSYPYSASMIAIGE